MKLNIQKKKLKQLSKDSNTISPAMTPKIGGGVLEPDTDRCQTHRYFCGDYTMRCSGGGGSVSDGHPTTMALTCPC
ncbi:MULTISPECIES: hypothetical protein [Pseudoalteromonas]|uniref:Uncharacterized protein n=1 Tax=Pseudoalteromonas obscura TaxID=3048491 RepID=A0ABT7EDV0_9GAMM|nr:MULTISPECIES: hypothetical protein [Pseudoalteromonas]MBQ4836549.1 hypothetical protein [Pseudoalteromonas luteoviolacea]MDK2593460.1 hypothetical protein [Pseudoalteromonas sp. P94(2023)]